MKSNKIEFGLMILVGIIFLGSTILTKILVI